MWGFGKPTAASEFVSTSLGLYPRLNGTTLTALSWNMYKQRRSGFWNTLRVAGAMPNAVLMCQEAWLTDADARKFSLFGEAYMATAFTKGGRNCGAMALSRYDLACHFAIRTSQLEPLVRTPKASVGVSVLLGDARPVLMVSTHGLNMCGDAALLDQLKQVESEIRAEGAERVVWCGDFNTKDASRTETMMNFMKDAGYAQACCAPHQNGKTLDWIWVRGHKAVASATSLADFTASDHPLLIAKIDF